MECVWSKWCVQLVIRVDSARNMRQFKQPTPAVVSTQHNSGHTRELGQWLPTCTASVLHVPLAPGCPTGRHVGQALLGGHGAPPG
jgi:hypothetical protein